MRKFNLIERIEECILSMPTLSLKCIVAAVFNFVLQCYVINTFYYAYVGQSELFGHVSAFMDVILCLVVCGATAGAVISGLLLHERLDVTITLFAVPAVCCILANVFSSPVLYIVVKIIYTAIFAVLGIIPSICMGIGILIINLLHLSDSASQIAKYVVLFASSVLEGIIIGLLLYNNSIGSGGGGGHHFTVSSDSGETFDVFQDW